MNGFREVVANAAERLRALEIREVIYFHCDHFEPWDFASQTKERAAEHVVDFVNSVGKVDFARRLTLFYSNPLNTRLSSEGDLVRAAPDDSLGFVRRSEADHDTLGAPLRHLRANSDLEIQIHIHHENFTWTRGMRDPARAEYLRRKEARALDGARLECALEQWLYSARREFDYAPKRWFFVHGLWSLNGSDPEGCNIHDEIARLMKWGCRGDFTFPAGRPHCDPRFEAPYFCTPALGPKSYDSEAAHAEFAWGNGQAADKFFIWNSPIKAGAASLDWGDPGVRGKLAQPEPSARQIIDSSFRWDGVLFIKTHAHSMHRMNRDDDGRLVYPHCYGPTRDLYGAIFDGASAAGATVTLATVGEVYDRFVAAPQPETVPPMSSFRPSLADKELGHIEPVGERVLETAARVDELAIAALRARISETGAEESGAGAHYATLAERGSVIPKHDLRAAQIVLSQFGARHPVHEIGAGIGCLPLLLAALGIPALGMERSRQRYEACVAVGEHVARHWDEPLAPYEFLHGSFPECVDAEDLSDKIAVITDFTCTMDAEERLELIFALRGYGAVLLDLDRFIGRISGTEARRKLIEEFRSLGVGPIYDADISSDFAFVLIVNTPSLLAADGATPPSGPGHHAEIRDEGVDRKRHEGETRLRALGEAGSDHHETLRIALSAPFEREVGHCWINRLGALPESSLLASMADHDAEPTRSEARLCENGTLLAPAHATHTLIRTTGHGTFSHWKDRLYFSTSDNSDPNLNGRQYELLIKAPIERFDRSPVDRKPDPVGSAVVEEVHNVRKNLFSLADFTPDGGFGFTSKLPVPGDDEQNPHRSSLVLLEDGVALGPAHTPHAAIRAKGGGRYSHWQDAVYFSTSDGSHPRTNGRIYHAYIAGDLGHSAASSRAIEALRRLPASYAPEEAYAAVEAALAALYPKAVLGDPHKVFWHDEAFERDYRRVCGKDRRSMERKYTVLQLVKALGAVDGELAECGTRNGESAYFMALAGRQIGRERPLHIFDSFEGLSSPTEYDGSFWTAGALAAPEENLRNNLQGFDRVHIYKGWIPSRFPEIADRRFCFVHIDVDLFEPTRDSLAFFYDRLEPGGMLLCDDYGSTLCPGARKSMNEFFSDKPEYVIDLPTEQGFIVKL